MTMDPDRDNFEQLRRLMALKRHEQPPPGYFHSFSGQVITRIRAANTAPNRSWWARFVGETPWFDRVFGGLDMKPAFAGAMSFAVCGLIAAGLFYAEAPAVDHRESLSAGVQAVVGPFGIGQPVALAPTNDFLAPPALKHAPLYMEASFAGRAPRAQNLKFTY